MRLRVLEPSIAPWGVYVFVGSTIWSLMNTVSPSVGCWNAWMMLDIFSPILGKSGRSWLVWCLLPSFLEWYDVTLAFNDDDSRGMHF